MSVLELFPAKGREFPLTGLYLGLNLHKQAAAGEVLIYANYIASLDGRISVRDANSGEQQVPAAIANKRDWRLYQELAAQSDVMLTSARYFRQLAKGCAQDLLPVGNEPEYADLKAWRQKQGLKAQPDVAVISNSLEIPRSALEKLTDRRVLVFTSEHADESAVAALKASGVRVHMAGKRQVEASALREQLITSGYRSAYMIAGPKIHRTLIAAGALDYLFLTTYLSLLGGSDFRTILTGEAGDSVGLDLQRLCLDRHESPAQLFGQYALQER